MIHCPGTYGRENVSFICYVLEVGVCYGGAHGIGVRRRVAYNIDSFYLVRSHELLPLLSSLVEVSTSITVRMEGLSRV